jgi:hypothetical protein
MGEIGVVVTKSVRIDRDGARSLLRAYSDWLNREVLASGDVVSVGNKTPDTFLKRYADLKPEEM